MKPLIPLFFLMLLLSQNNILAQTEFIIEPSQSMIMTGKGPGQDATINPFEGKDCFAIIRNIGEREFSVRIQNNNRIIRELSIEKNEVKKIKVNKGYQLYFDPVSDGIAKASIEYAPADS